MKKKALHLRFKSNSRGTDSENNSKEEEQGGVKKTAEDNSSYITERRDFYHHQNITMRHSIQEMIVFHNDDDDNDPCRSGGDNDRHTKRQRYTILRHKTYNFYHFGDESSGSKSSTLPHPDTQHSSTKKKDKFRFRRRRSSSSRTVRKQRKGNTRSSFFSTTSWSSTITKRRTRRATLGEPALHDASTNDSTRAGDTDFSTLEKTNKNSRFVTTSNNNPTVRTGTSRHSRGPGGGSHESGSDISIRRRFSTGWDGGTVHTSNLPYQTSNDTALRPTTRRRTIQRRRSSASTTHSIAKEQLATTTATETTGDVTRKPAKKANNNQNSMVSRALRRVAQRRKSFAADRAFLRQVITMEDQVVSSNMENCDYHHHSYTEAPEDCASSTTTTAQGDYDDVLLDESGVSLSNIFYWGLQTLEEIYFD